MTNEQPPQQPGASTSTSLRNEFERQQQQRTRNGMSGTIPYVEPGPEKETSVTTDLGNFVKLIFEFFAGLIHQDMSRFDLLSSVWFPPTREKAEPGTPGAIIDRGVDRLNTASRDPNDPLRHQPVGDTVRELTQGLPTNFPTTLPDEMVKTMERNTPAGQRLRNYVDITKAAIARHNTEVDTYNIANPDKRPHTKLNETWVLRQFWQESRFQPDARASRAASNGEHATGISQMLPSTAAQYGVTERQLHDPKISIETGVKHIGARTNYYGNQLFALFDYSGGPGSLDYAARELVKKGTIKDRAEMTPDHVIQFFRDERADLDRRLRAGTVTRSFYNSRWAVESLDYITRYVAPDFDRRLYAFAAIAPVGQRVSSEFQVRHVHPVTGAADAPHRGTDYSVPMKTPLLATNQALVVHTERHNGYGKTLVLAHGHGVFEMYAHLNSYNVRDGQIVKPGDRLAFSGDTGLSTGAHLHHEWWIERNGRIFTVDARDAEGKNLKDPAVQDELIERAQTKLAGKAEVSISDAIPANIRGMGAELTNRIQENASTGYVRMAGLSPTGRPGS